MTTVQSRTYRPLTTIALSASIVAVVASVVNALIALSAVGLGATAAGGLLPQAYISFTVIAAIAGAAGWHLINRYTRRPERIMTWLIPAFLVVSFIPDVGVGLTLGWLTAGALMVMHITTIAIAVISYRRFMPLYQFNTDTLS